jgi:hypothetical protein
MNSSGIPITKKMRLLYGRSGYLILRGWKRRMSPILGMHIQAAYAKDIVQYWNAHITGEANEA